MLYRIIKIKKKKMFLNILYHARFFSILRRMQSLKLLSKQEFEACALDQKYIIFFSFCTSKYLYYIKMKKSIYYSMCEPIQSVNKV